VEFIVVNNVLSYDEYIYPGCNNFEVNAQILCIWPGSVVQASAKLAKD
jgi:hypothetical protein